MSAYKKTVYNCTVLLKIGVSGRIRTAGVPLRSNVRVWLWTPLESKIAIIMKTILKIE